MEWPLTLKLTHEKDSIYVHMGLDSKLRIWSLREIQAERLRATREWGKGFDYWVGNISFNF